MKQLNNLQVQYVNLIIPRIFSLFPDRTQKQHRTTDRVHKLTMYQSINKKGTKIKTRQNNHRNNNDVAKKTSWRESEHDLFEWEQKHCANTRAAPQRKNHNEKRNCNCAKDFVYEPKKKLISQRDKCQKNIGNILADLLMPYRLWLFLDSICLVVLCRASIFFVHSFVYLRFFSTLLFVCVEWWCFYTHNFISALFSARKWIQYNEK